MVRKSWGKVISVAISALMIWMYGADLILGAQTVTAATIKMSHTPVKYFVPGFRISVDVRAADPSGIMLVRCYFRAKGEADYVFIEMNQAGTDLYQGVLPAPSRNTVAIEYILLAVNLNKVVVRSQTFTAYKVERPEVPAWQKAEMSGQITVKTELAQAPQTIPGFTDSITTDIVESAFRFGYVVEGIYILSQLAGAAPVAAVSGGTISATSTAATVAGTTSGATAATAGGTTAAAGGAGLTTAAAVVGGAVVIGGGIFAATKLLGAKKVSVTIRVWDNGSDNDDVFQVSLDGSALGSTPKGGSDSWTESLKEDSSHTLTIRCTDAPDDAGTWGVSISNSDIGSDAGSLQLNQSTSISFKVGKATH